MEALHLLQVRSSVAKLEAPGPTPDQCSLLIKAATRAADHGNLKPWRFLFIAGEHLTRLGRIFAEAAASVKPDISRVELTRLESMPLRAPMILVVVAKCCDHPKVPKLEQLVSAGAAAQNIINAAYAMGLGAIWRTGDMAYDQHVALALGLAEGESITGFIYLGSPQGGLPEAKVIDPENFFEFWQG